MPSLPRAVLLDDSVGLIIRDICLFDEDRPCLGSEGFRGKNIPREPRLGS